MESVGQSYGLALFELAKEDQQLEAYKHDLDFVLSALDREAQRFLNQSLVALNERLAIIEKCFKYSIKPNTLNFLKLLCVLGRINYLAEIVKEFYTLYNIDKGILEGVVYAVNVLDTATLNEIEKAVSQKEGKKVLLNQKLDTSLLGGIKVVIGDRVYDGSLKNKINSLQSELLKG